MCGFKSGKNRRAQSIECDIESLSGKKLCPFCVKMFDVDVSARRVHSGVNGGFSLSETFLAEDDGFLNENGDVVVAVTRRQSRHE